MRMVIHVVAAAMAVTALVATSPANATAHAAMGRGAVGAVDMPVVGECHLYKYAEVDHASEKSKAIPCDQKHTAQVIAVVKVPKRIPFADSLGVFDATGPACYRALAKTLHGNLAFRTLSAYNFAFFVPTKAEQAAGARWVRCDLILEGGRKLMPLPTPFLSSRPLPDDVARCLLKAGPALLPTVCSRKHSYRAAGIVKLKGSYKTPRVFLSIAAKSCPRVAGKGWVVTYPNDVAWRAGNREITCSRATTK
jgi:Septum formation